MAEEFRLESSELIAPITALQFVDSKLFVGEGPYLSVYESTDGKRITIKRVFHTQRIHHIQVCDLNNVMTVAVCGGKAASVLYFQQSANTSELSAVGTSLFCDWIWDICLINVPMTVQVAVATGHNAVWLWNIGEDWRVKISQCEEQCILYCARFIGHTLETLWLACGTVFNEVLLWKVKDGKNSDGNVRVHVSKRLGGHDGVIFSVAFNEERQIICSVSDDRSVKVWKLNCPLNDPTSVEVAAQPLLVLYGHKARVWDCLILTRYVVTIGEDSTCLVWNSNGEIVKKFTGHTGKSIWSLADGPDEQMIATGGGDGGVRVWSLIDDIKDTQDQHAFSEIPQKETTSPPTKDIPRTLGFLPDNNVLILTDQGNFYKYCCPLEDDKNSQTGSWEFLRNESDFCSYSVMALSPCRTIIALGNIHGDVKLLSTVEPAWCSLRVKPYDGKILCLHWIKDEDVGEPLKLFCCGPDGCIIWWTISCLNIERQFLCEVKTYFRLPYCRQRWPNSIFIVPKEVRSLDMDNKDDGSIPLVICGDRRGSLHIFKGCDKDKPLDPLHSHIGIHGSNGVTHITSYLGFIYTAGRDGYFRQFKLNGTNLALVDKRKVYKGLEWIEQLNFTQDGDLLVLGFHTVDFVIWSMKKNEILQNVQCGGGHRVWDFLYSDTNVQTTVTFAYLKKMTVHVHKLPRRKIPHTSILQECFHGREATCVCFIPPLESSDEVSSYRFMATGSEDTNINIMAYNPKANGRKFTKIFTCQGHISSVRCLALIKVKHTHNKEPAPFEYLLFSGGGRASLKCWSVNLTNISLFEPNIVPPKVSECSHPACTLIAELPSQVSRYRRKRIQRQALEGSSCDIRFMSLSVFSSSDLMKLDVPIYGVLTGCSDGQLRFYAMDCKTRRFELIGQFVWNDKCVLFVGHFVYCSPRKPRLIVYTADTAGRIAFWDFTELFTEHFSRVSENERIELLTEERLNNETEAFEQGGSRKDFERLNICPDDDLAFVANKIPEQCEENNCNEVAQAFPRKPFYQHNLHQSGVNSVSIQRQGTDHYLLCSGGDDGAITVASFQVCETESIVMQSWCSLSVPDAHTSSTTGVKILDDGFFLSTSVDQRLKLWKAVIDKDSGIAVTLNETHFVDVADVQDLGVHRNRDGSYHIVVCGVGLQMVNLKPLS